MLCLQYIFVAKIVSKITHADFMIYIITIITLCARINCKVFLRTRSLLHLSLSPYITHSSMQRFCNLSRRSHHLLSPTFIIPSCVHNPSTTTSLYPALQYQHHYFATTAQLAPKTSNKNKSVETTPKYRRKRTSHPKPIASTAEELAETEVGDDEYIPEMDWDHTRFHDHYERIWEEPKEAPTIREKIYNVGLRMISFTAVSIALGCVLFGSFIFTKMHKQLKHVNTTQRSLRKTRKIFEEYNIANEIGKENGKGKELINLSYASMNVSDIKNELKEFSDSNDKLDIKVLENECHVWKRLIAQDIDISHLADWQRLGIIALEDTTYLLALMQYFMGQPRKKGTPVKFLFVILYFLLFFRFLEISGFFLFLFVFLFCLHLKSK